MMMTSDLTLSDQVKHKMRFQSLLIAAAIASLLSVTATNARAATRAVRANDFLSSIGVNTHFAGI
jgi:hypothetical protein